MTVGIGLVELYLLEKPDNLKAKRSVINRLKSKLKQSFSISLAEVDHQDVYHLCTLGFAMVTGELGEAQEIIQKILNYLNRITEVEIVHQMVEFENYKLT